MRPHEHNENRVISALIKEFSEVLADTIIERLRPEINRLLNQKQNGTLISQEQSNPSPVKTPQGTLWSINAIARDSGTSPATWRKWILQRKIPVVRLGRLVRIRDVDNKKLISKSFTPELNLEKEAGRFR